MREIFILISMEWLLFASLWKLNLQDLLVFKKSFACYLPSNAAVWKHCMRSHCKHGLCIVVCYTKCVSMNVSQDSNCRITKHKRIHEKIQCVKAFEKWGIQTNLKQMKSQCVFSRRPARSAISSFKLLNAWSKWWHSVFHPNTPSMFARNISKHPFVDRICQHCCLYDTWKEMIPKVLWKTLNCTVA